MLADLDLLLTYVFCVADDLLPEKPANYRRSLSDAEVVTLAVAQAIMGIPSDYRFIRTAVKQLRHLFPGLTKRSGYFKRRDRLADTIEWLIPMFASQTPGWNDDLLLVDSTPWSAPAPVKRSNVAGDRASMTRSRTLLTTATAPATADTSTACDCTRSRPRTAPRER